MSSQFELSTELKDQYESMIDPPDGAFPEKMSKMTPSQVLAMGVMEYAILEAAKKGESKFYVDGLKRDLASFMARFSNA